MTIAQIKPGIYSVGAIDWNLRHFHGPSYSTHQGSSYNAYLIIDEQITLVDTVYKPFTADLIEHISAIVDPSTIDIVVVNHTEPDHSGAFPDIMRLNPSAKVYASKAGAISLNQHYSGEWDIQTVKTGDTVSIGKRTLQFIEAPMLHWPDSMFTYIPEEKLLLSNDAFGQHYAANMLFDDQLDLNIIMREAAKYYANILYPFSKLVLKKLAEIEDMGIEIDMIAPGHGIIWRQHIPEILGAYQRWARGEAADRVIIAYDTMYDSTAKLAHAMLEGVSEHEVEARLYRISKTDLNDLLTEMMDAKAILVGSSTLNNGTLPSVAPLLDELVGLKLNGRLGLAFGSQGWAGGSVKVIEEALQAVGLDLVAPGFSIKWVPTEQELTDARAIGKIVAQRILSK